MVEEEGMAPSEWARRWTEGPARLIGVELVGETVVDLQANKTVDPDSFRSKSRNQPYTGMRFTAWPVAR